MKNAKIHIINTHTVIHIHMHTSYQANTEVWSIKWKSHNFSNVWLCVCWVDNILILLFFLLLLLLLLLLALDVKRALNVHSNFQMAYKLPCFFFLVCNQAICGSVTVSMYVWMNVFVCVCMCLNMNVYICVVCLYPL